MGRVGKEISVVPDEHKSYFVSCSLMLCMKDDGN